MIEVIEVPYLCFSEAIFRIRHPQKTDNQDK